MTPASFTSQVSIHLPQSTPDTARPARCISLRRVSPFSPRARAALRHVLPRAYAFALGDGVLQHPTVAALGQLLRLNETTRRWRRTQAPSTKARAETVAFYYAKDEVSGTDEKPGENGCLS